MPSKKITPKAEKKAIEKIVFTSLSAEELADKAKALRKEIAGARLQMKVGRLRNLRKVFTLRKELARVLSVLNVKITSNHENH